MKTPVCWTLIVNGEEQASAPFPDGPDLAVTDLMGVLKLTPGDSVSMAYRTETGDFTYADTIQMAQPTTCTAILMKRGEPTILRGDPISLRFPSSPPKASP